MKETKGEFLRRSKGITLVALVVTIVILIILASVSINVMFGENGIIQLAQDAKKQTESTITREETELNLLAQEYANIMATEPDTTGPTVSIATGKITKTSIEITVTASDPSGLATSGTYKFFLNGTEKTTNETGNYTFIGLAEETSYIIKVEARDKLGNVGSATKTVTIVDPTAKWDLNKVNKVESEDKIIVPVPKGYVASTVAGEKSVDTGFVIKEGNNGAATEGINEFVWVPVENISDLYDSANNAGQLWDFGTKSAGWKNPAVKRAYPTTQNSEYREPDVVTDASSGSDSTSGNRYDAISSNLEQAGLPANSTAENFKTQLQNEFKEMRESVATYGGFYIGRYETGNLSQVKAVVQKGNTDICDETWYTQYKLSKTIAVNDNVKSSMIWGSQWDATMRWMQSSSNPEVSNFPTNSATQGNYKDNSIEYIENGETKKTTEGTATIIPTGSAQVTKVNNIYDMAGNVYDRTIEANGTYDRVLRGRWLPLFSNWSSLSSRQQPSDE